MLLLNKEENIEKENLDLIFTGKLELKTNMIDKNTIDFVSDIGCGSRDYRRPYSHQNHGQYRWRCTHRDAYEGV